MTPPRKLRQCSAMTYGGICGEFIPLRMFTSPGLTVKRSSSPFKKIGHGRRKRARSARRVRRPARDHRLQEVLTEASVPHHMVRDLPQVLRRRLVVRRLKLAQDFGGVVE